MTEETKQLFEPHMIARSLNQDFNSILVSPEMDEFTKGLSFKSDISKEKDKALMNLLLNKIKQYKSGWIKANMLSTAELWNKGLLLDEQEQSVKPRHEALIECAESLNNCLNRVIVIMKENIPENALKELREMERELIKIKGQ